MPTVLDAQFGIAAESTYGTAVTNAFSYADGQWQLTQNYSNK